MADSLRLNPIPLSELKGGDNLLQSRFWGAFKEKAGWKPFPFRYDWNGRTLYLLVLVRRLGRVLPIAYVPFGPELTGRGDEDHLRLLGEALLTELPLGTLFVRFDLRGDREEFPGMPKEAGLAKASADIQPPDSVILDITRSEEELLAGMHKKWRYNIGLAEKKGVLVEEASPDRLSDWYELYRITGERDRIALHPESYYRSQFDLCRDLALAGGTGGVDYPDLRLWTASFEGELLAGIITSFYGNRATYLYGASSNSKRNLMASYALQWKAMGAAKEAGCGEYDFFGIPPKDDPDHPMHGLYKFKVNFGGTPVHYHGCWDRVYGRLFYYLYRGAESLRFWYYKDLKKRG